MCQGRVFPLAHGQSFTRTEFPMLSPSQPGGAVAVVVTHPSDPAMLGLRNMTGHAWTAWMPDGTQRQVVPGQTMRLADGIVVQWGSVQAQVRAAVAESQSPHPAPGPTAALLPGLWTAPTAYGLSSAPAPRYALPAPPSPHPFPPAVAVAAVAVAAVAVNDSGTGATAVLPPQLRGFNWGAFMLGWIWSVGNRTWIGLLCFIPAAGWPMTFVLGFKGNEWAWQNRHWDSPEHFRKVQRQWAIWAVVLLAIWSVLCLAKAIIS